MSRFPHLTANGNESAFPDISNIRTYQYDNSYDYSKFDTVQMNITLCKVPWDMGEAHIGNRTISGIGNVVHFGTKAQRDKWFDDIPDSDCFRFATKYRELHRDNAIVVPIPYDVAARYNYIAVYYEPMASAENPIMYETTGGIDAWFWFVREVEFLSPNSTKLHLLNDAWQTFIYDMDIPYMMLDRGHAPMHETNVSSYLANPIANCKYLLAPEENEPEAPRITISTHEHVFNTGTMYAVIITTANPQGTWGTKSDNTWTVPSSQVLVSGVPSYHAFAVPAGSLSGFLAAVPEQFIQTVQAVCFVSSNMITLGSSFTFGGYTCYSISSGYKQATVHTIAKSDFGYPSEYADVAKLYSFPYAVLRLTDQDGNQTDIRVEDTNGKIQLDYCVSLAYPWLKINAQVTSTGKATRKSVSFANATTQNMPIEGNWHDLLMSLDIPTFAVTQSAGNVNDYATHYDRLQQATAADNAQANQNANAALITDNATLTTTANTSSTTISNSSAGDSLDNVRTYNFDAMDSDNATTNATASATIQAQEQQAAVAAASAAASGVAGAIGAAASGDIGGAISSGINALIGGATTIASTAVSVHLASAEAAIAVQNNEYHSEAATDKSQADTYTQQATATSLTNVQNTLTTGQAANSAATIIANAARDRSTVSSAIANQQAQAAIGEPSTFGDFQNGDYATSRPLALFSNVVTQDDYTIRKCGDDFLRYGYSYGAQWTFDGNWCPMKHFTYWRLTDFWVKGLQIPDMYVDKLRFFLFGGVTVWKKPEDIGRVSLYENV